MIRLDLSSSPSWLEVAPGVRLQLKPMTTALMLAARRDPEVQRLEEAGRAQDAMPDAHVEQMALAMSRAIARLAIVGWDGVGDQDGNPIPPSAEGVSALLDHWPIFEAFQTRYVAKGMALEAEGNGSPPLQNGNSAGATPFAAAVPNPAPVARAS